MVSKTFITSALVAAVSAHQNLHEFFVNGVSPGYEIGIRKAPSNSPVEDITSNDMACNVGGDKVPSGVETVEAKEGDTITVSWDVSSHPGPIQHFLFGPVDDASQATGVGEWFKIDMLNYEGGKWANEIMQSNVSNGGMTHEFKLPTGLQSGEYLLRSEMLALHAAQTVGGAQWYMGCMQLKITGTGAGTCGPTIQIPGTYKAEDENIYIPNVYNGFDPTTYTAPGGPVATCGGSGSSPSTPSTSAAAPSGNSTLPTTAPEAPVSSAAPVETPAPEEPETPAPEPTVAAPESGEAPAATEAPVEPEEPAATETPIGAPSASFTLAQPSITASFPAGNDTLPTVAPTGSRPTTLVTSARPLPSGGAGGAGAKKYYQCGGLGWKGATTCESGLTCTQHNDYYHQCL